MPTDCTTPSSMVFIIESIDADEIFPHLLTCVFAIVLLGLTMILLLEFSSPITRYIRAFTDGIRPEGFTYGDFHEGEEVDVEKLDLGNGEPGLMWPYMVHIPEKSGEIV